MLNKVDIAKKDDLLLLAARLSEQLKPETIFLVSCIDRRRGGRIFKRILPPPC